MSTVWDWCTLMLNLSPFEFLVLSGLGFLCVGMMVACVLLWYLATRREPQALGWEVVDSVDAEEPAVGPSDDAMPNPPIQRRRRMVRPVDLSAPWDREAQGYVPSVTFPDEFLHQWPDERPAPAKLPDEEGR